MSHTHASVLVHCVFSTKNRADIIPDCEALWRYLAVLAKDNQITLLAAGGTKNHVHLLMALPPVAPLAKVMKEMKGSSSRWLHEHGHRFAWQEGYGAFSVNPAQREAVIHYIDTQGLPRTSSWAKLSRPARRDGGTCVTGEMAIYRQLLHRGVTKLGVNTVVRIVAVKSITAHSDLE